MDFKGRPVFGLLQKLFLSTALMSGTLLLSACGGSAPGAPPSAQQVILPPPPPQSPVDVVVSGTVTYERVPLNPVTNGLDYNNSFNQPVRGAIVQLLNSSGAVMQTTRADDNGRYSFTVTSDTQVRVSVRAELLETGANDFDVQIRDNTSGNAIYVLQGNLAGVGRTAQTRNLFAASGWDGTSYSRTRAAAPFALLDTIYGSLQDFITIDPAINFPAFDVLWSINNRPERGDVAEGEIGSSSFTVSRGVPTIRIVGQANNDTDEYDIHVVTHEFGHYIENQFSRADSLGGPHSLSNRLDPRVALSEGWGNALSGILTGDPIYRDSLGQSQTRGFRFSIENNNVRNPGWYSESSVQSILYDIFDDRDDGADRIALGLTPLYETFINSDFINTDVATTIFAYLDILERQPGIDIETIRALKREQQIFGTGVLGIGEANDGRLATNLPVFRPIAADGNPVTVCSVNDNGIFNRLGNRLFLVFDVSTRRNFAFDMQRISGPTGRDPDFRIFNRGRIVGGGISPDRDRETANITLPAGRYMISALDDFNIRINDEDEIGADSCFMLTIR